jgi:CHAT domain-containing protein/tetratricopeptide (TPR) repeat protein
VARADDLQDLLGKIKEFSALVAQQRFKEAEPIGKRMIELSESKFRDDPALRIVCFGLMTGLYDVQGKYAEEERHIQGGLFLSDYVGGAEDLPAVKSLNMIALAFQGQGRYREAERLYKRALEINEKALSSDHTDVASGLMRLVTVTIAQGRLAEAELYCRRLLSLAGEKDKDAKYARALVSLATIYVAQGRIGEAELLAQEAESVAEGLDGSEATLVSSLDCLSSVYRAQGRYKEAEPLIKRALTTTQQMNLMEKPGFLAMKHENLAEVYRLQKKYSTALLQIDKAIDILKQHYGDQRSRQTSCLIELARIKADQGLLSEALADLDQAILALPEHQRYRALFLRADLYWREKQHDRAVADLRLAMDIALAQRLQISGAEQERALSLGKYMESFTRMVAWQAQLGDVGAAFAAAEQARARSLLEQMQSADIDLLLGVEKNRAAALRRREADAQVAIAVLQKRLKELEKAADPDLKQQSDVQQKIEEARQRYVDAYREIRNASPLYRLSIAKDRKPVDLAELQSFLVQADACLLEYVVSGDGVFVLIVPGVGDKPRIERLAISDEQAKALGVEPGTLTEPKLRELMANRERTGVVQLLRRPRLSSRLMPALEAFGSVLVPGPVRSALENGKIHKLVIVPDGPLATLPFEALRFAEGEKSKYPEKSKYLIDLDVPITYVPSATILWNLAAQSAKKAPDSGRPVLTVGDADYRESSSESGLMSEQLTARSRYAATRHELKALPFTAFECRQVKTHFEDAGMPVLQLSGKAATEANVRQAIPGSKVVHVACHGLADQAWGNLFGALALTPGPKAATEPADDGFLTLAEIPAIDCRDCDLVILSACETNYGPEQRGEGVSALTRGFLAAGARRIVASDWLVDDEAAAILIGGFTERVAKAMKNGGRTDYASCLHAAKLGVRQKAKWQHPFFWAPFVLVGPN